MIDLDDEIELDERISVAQSPIPQEVEILDEVFGEDIDFHEALREMIKGKKVTKREWTNENIYGVIDHEILKIHMDNDTLNAWTLSAADIVGTDYKIIK